MLRILTAMLAVMVFCAPAAAQNGSTEWDSGSSSSGKIPLSPEGYTYEGLLALGHGQYVGGNWAGAITQYEKARNLVMDRPQAHYFIACAQIRQQRFTEAMSTLRTAATVAGTRDPEFAAKVLYMIAIAFEAAGDQAQAKFAWSEYLNHPGARQPAPRAIAEERIAGIEAASRRQAEYQIVRDRISGAGK